MLQTIEIEIDSAGKIHPTEHLAFKPQGRALLTLLEQPKKRRSPVKGRGSKILALLASDRFLNRPQASAEEVNSRIAQMRDDWERSL